MKIAIVVQGRFHAFDLANALLNRGHDVTVFTKGGRLVVKYDRTDEDTYQNIWLCGPAEKVFEGSIDLNPQE